MTAAGTLVREDAVRRGALERLELDAWRTDYGVVAGITSRAGEFNLGLTTDEPAAAVVNRWCEFLTGMEPGFHAFVFARQVHGNAITVHGPETRGWVMHRDLDGHATVARGILLMVSVADCVPVYLAHPNSGAIMLLHAGWRGVASGILETGVQQLEDLSGSASRNDIVMHCGVSICGSCYEVGPEVHHAVTGASAAPRGPLDLRGELVRRAERAGVGRISRSPWCTAHDERRFFSHRRSGGADGRMVAYLGVPAA